jgi:uncharacterized membrane protein
VWTALFRALRHLWLDADDARRAVPDALAAQWQDAVVRGEGQVGGEIRLCVEASLPLGELWRAGARYSLDGLVRQRALTLFGELGVWDTERNTGVLIYVLLAEHAIEIVADRGLRGIAPAQWQAIADELAQAFRKGQQHKALMQALARVQALLAGLNLPADAVNELPDWPQRQ